MWMDLEEEVDRPFGDLMYKKGAMWEGHDHPAGKMIFFKFQGNATKVVFVQETRNKLTFLDLDKQLDLVTDL